MASQPAPSPRAGPGRAPFLARARAASLVALEILLGVGGLLGGGGLMARPSGPDSLMPQAFLAGTPFQDYFWPGAILVACNGVFPLAVAGLALKGAPAARFGHPLVGVVLTIWMVVQVAMLGWRSAIQPVYLGLGLVLMALGTWQLVAGAAPGAGPAARRR